VQALTIIITVIGSVISGVALFLITRYFKRKDEKDEARDKAKANESVLIIKSLNAVGHLTEATAIALRDGHSNGEVTAALKEYSAVDKELYNYLLEQNAHK